jgi:hypothetical protein
MMDLISLPSNSQKKKDVFPAVFVISTSLVSWYVQLHTGTTNTVANKEDEEMRGKKYPKPRNQASNPRSRDPSTTTFKRNLGATHSSPARKKEEGEKTWCAWKSHHSESLRTLVQSSPRQSFCGYSCFLNIKWLLR